MNGFVKWIKNHAVTLVCSLLIVLVLVFFFWYVTGLVAANTELDEFRYVCDKISAVSLDLSVLSEYETEHRDPESTEKIDIPREGDIQEVRDKVFSTRISSGFTYLSDNGGYGAYYVYDADGDHPCCIIRYEKGNADKLRGSSDFCMVIGDSIFIERRN